jgi:hypothetical protein
MMRYKNLSGRQVGHRPAVGRLGFWRGFAQVGAVGYDGLLQRLA